MMYSNLEIIKDAPEINGFSDNRMIEQSAETKAGIADLEAVMLTMDSALDDFPVTHHFAPGVYAREMFLPAGGTIVGKIHRHAHLNIISKGRVIVTTEGGTDELTGPCTFTSYAGTKRAVHVIEDTIWTTIHVTEETDLEKIEAEVIAPSYDALPDSLIKRIDK
jgi:quercetin dioxygenase-like cupin family protein